MVSSRSWKLWRVHRYFPHLIQVNPKNVLGFLLLRSSHLLQMSMPTLGSWLIHVWMASDSPDCQAQDCQARFCVSLHAMSFYLHRKPNCLYPTFLYEHILPFVFPLQKCKDCVSDLRQAKSSGFWDFLLCSPVTSHGPTLTYVYIIIIFYIISCLWCCHYHRSGSVWLLCSLSLF